MIGFDRGAWDLVRAALHRAATREHEFATLLGTSAAATTEALTALVEEGVFSSPEPATWLLTEKGRDLGRALGALDAWELRWSASAVIGADGPATVEIELLGSFVLRVDGRAVAGLATGSQRLLVSLALHDREVGRVALAGRMWPDVSDELAGVSLRAALARLDPATRSAVVVTTFGVGLADGVGIDLRRARALAHRLEAPASPVADSDLDSRARAVLSSELLPDWYDDWVVREAEDWRQLRLSALESLAHRLADLERHGEAAGAARAAIKVEPLRESGHAALIRVHLAEGNPSEAIRVHDRYRSQLHSAIGLVPTPRLTAMIADIRAQ